MDEDRTERISRKSVRAIAKAAHVSVAEVNRVSDAWAEEAIGNQLRKPACVWNSSGSTNDGVFIVAPSMMPICVRVTVREAHLKTIRDVRSKSRTDDLRILESTASSEQ
jgi:hypothetical protein